MAQDEHNPFDHAAEDRRKFLAACGRFALVTPPAMTLLLSTSLNSTAVAQSAGNNGTSAMDTVIAVVAATAIAVTATTAATAMAQRLRKL